MANFKNAKKGKYPVQNPDKYINLLNESQEDAFQPTYRSSWELEMFRWLDTNPRVIKWAPELIKVKYKNPFTGKIHRYLIDIFMRVKEGNSYKDYLIEIKPEMEKHKPSLGKGKNARRNYEMALRTYVVNQAKWKAAKAFADKNNMIFKVLTEVELFGVQKKK